MAVLGRSRSGPPPDQILDPPLRNEWTTAFLTQAGFTDYWPLRPTYCK